MEVLRRQMSENLKKLRGAERAAPRSGEQARVSNQAAAPDLRQALARRIGALDATDPLFQAKAADVFVESILVSEFGEAQVNDPAFREMIGKVAETMRSDAAIAADLADLFSDLRSERRR